MLMKVMTGYFILSLLIASIWLFASPDNARQLTLSTCCGAIAAWVISQKRCVTSEGFRLVDHYGNLRAELGLMIPALVQSGGPMAGARQGISGEQLDTAPMLNLYRKNGEKAAMLSLESGPEGAVSLVLYGPGGFARVGLVNSGGNKGLVIMNGELDSPSAALTMSDGGEPTLQLVGINGKVLKQVPS